MEHKFLRLYKNGVWTGTPDRTIMVDGVKHDLDDYAKLHGIELPDSKPAKKAKKSEEPVNTIEDITDVNYGDLEEQDSTGDTEES
jgi:hypothetical protein